VPRPWWRTRAAAAVAVIGLGVAALVSYLALSGPNEGALGSATAWSRLGTADVHSLAFDRTDAQHIYFGHHNGLLESRDGGRTWVPTALTGADAMNVRAGPGSVLQIAGHGVYAETNDGGRTWMPVPNDLPGNDLHAFVIDPADPAHEWAYVVGFGLFESTDHGRHWESRQAGDWPVLTVTKSSGTTMLVGVSAAGLGASSDGRTWQPLAVPTGQIASLAAAADGSVLLAGTTQGLYRSVDAGKSWQPTGFTGLAITVAVAPSDPRVIGLVDDKTRFFRSEDGGATWPAPQ